MNGELRTWLKREPHPVRVRALINGDERTVRIGDSRSRWRDAEDALNGATRAEAIDADGELLRIWENERNVSSVERGADAGQLVELARLLNEAADMSVQRHGDAYRLAYEQQAMLVKVLSERLQALEAAWHRLLMSQAEAMQPDDPNLPLVMGVLGQLGSAVAGSMAAQPKPKPNGGKT